MTSAKTEDEKRIGKYNVCANQKLEDCLFKDCIYWKLSMLENKLNAQQMIQDSAAD